MARVMTLVAGALVVATVLLGLVWALQRRLLYFPDRSTPGPVEVGLGTAEQVTFQTADGLVLGGWFVRPTGVPSMTVLVFNGNAGNRAYRAPLAAALARRGFNTLLFDYRGYGGNPGTPTEDGLAADARAAYAYVVGRPDVDPVRLVYFGESLGTAVAVRLATEHPPAALILRSPFTSMADIGQHHYSLLPVGLLLSDRFAAVDHIRRLRSPLLVIAGDRDRVVPPSFSRRLFEAAPGAKSLVVVPGADHNDAGLLTGQVMLDAIVHFLAAVSAPPAVRDVPGRQDGPSGAVQSTPNR